MAMHIKASDAWKNVTQMAIKVSGSWANVAQAYIKVSGAWSQFWPGTQTYTFSFGNTVHVGTNGYISLDGGQSVDSISSTVDRVLGILPADLVMNNVYWAANSSNFYVFWSGKRYSVGTNDEIQYEVRFTDGQDYAQIKLVAFPTSTYSLTGYYVDGSSTGYSRINAARTVGAEYRVYFNTTAAFVSTFVELGYDSHPAWLPSGTVTSGTTDQGYFTILASQGSSSQAPTSVTASSITKTTATVSWTIPARESRGMSQIQSYDYSINSGSSWTSTGSSTSVGLTGLTASTSYTVLVRANNYYFTGVNYGTVTFSTSAGPVNTVLPTLSTNTGNFSSGSIITVSEGTWTGTTSYKYQILYSSGTPVATSSSFITANASNQYTITQSDATAPSYYFRAMVTGYEGAGQTGDSAIAYGVTSSRSYIVPTTTISVGTATSTGFTISGTAGPVTASAAYVSINEIYIYNSSQTLISTITSGLPSVAVSTGSWSYIWTGGAASTTYYAKVKVASTSSDVQYFTTAFSSSIETSAIVQYTVTWDANGGTVSPTSVTVTAGSSVTAPTPTRSGFTFSTWRNPATGGDPTFIAAGGSYTPTGNITYYAIWTAITPNISSIVMTPGGSSTPYMTATWSATNTASVSYSVYRSSSSAVNSPVTVPVVLGGSTNGSSIITNSGGLNFYYQFYITPYSGANLTGTAGTQRITGVKRNTTSGGPTTYNF